MPEIFALVLTFATVFACCCPPAVADAGKRTLRIALSSTPNSLNPLLGTQAIESFLGELSLDGLVNAAPDGKIEPVLASVVPTLANGGISRDGRTITYHLRHGVKWHDGAAFTSKDVVFSQHARVNPANNITTRIAYSFVAGLDAPDAWTVVVHLHQPYAPFVTQWFPDDGGPVLPAHLLEKYPDINKVAFDAAPVGTGPFIFDRWERGREIVYRANESYYLGKPAFDEIVIQLFADENTRTVALQTGDTDWSFRAGTTSARRLVGDSRIATKLLATNAQYGVTVQTRHPPLDDKRVRQAIAFAIDRPSLVAKISDKFGIAASGDIGPFDWAYDASIHPLPFDVKRSQAMFRSAGWTTGPSGKLERNGKPLSLLMVYATGATASEAYAVQIQGMLQNVGIDITLKPEQPNILFAPSAEHGTLQTGNFDLAISGFFNFADPDNRRLFSCNSFPPNGFNDSFWCNQNYDRVTNDALLHADRETRKRDYSFATKILIDEEPVIFLYWPLDVQLTRPGLVIDDGDRNIGLPYLWH